ncbi:MAG: holo-ACP synthase [Thioalkalivibrionaceae bacterium]
MIVGLGSDVVQSARIGAAWARFGERFLNRVLHPDERVAWQGRFDAVEAVRPPKDWALASLQEQAAVAWLARRFAAKEAAAKALGTGLGATTSWRDIVVLNDGNGRPRLRFEGGAARRAEVLGTMRMHVTLSDDAGVAFAVVVLEA